MQQPTSIRPFIGAKDFDISRAFYRDLGFEEAVLGGDLSVFKLGALAFYLQNYYSKDWVENSMIFMEVDDADKYFDEISALNLPVKYPGAKVSKAHTDYGKVCYVHDPSTILWHFGQFAK